MIRDVDVPGMCDVCLKRIPILQPSAGFTIQSNGSAEPEMRSVMRPRFKHDRSSWTCDRIVLICHRLRLSKPSIYFLVSMPMPSANFAGSQPPPPFDPRPSRPNLPLSFLEAATVESLAFRTRNASRYTLLCVSEVVGACGRRIHTTHQPLLVLQVRSSSELWRWVETWVLRI